jgi:hypothetical protein
VVGHLEPSRIVLLCAGGLTVLGSGLIRMPASASEPAA